VALIERCPHRKGPLYIQCRQILASKWQKVIFRKAKKVATNPKVIIGYLFIYNNNNN
jgi:hypothetical protein